MKNDLARRVALTGMLFALAIALSFFESLVTPLLALPPGIKLGLANIVVMYALLFLSWRPALMLVVLKAGFGLLTRGGMAGLLSLSGGLVSLGVMVLLMLPKNRVSVLVISIVGAVCHNLAQLLVIALVMGRYSLYYAPVLVVAGVVVGLITAILLRVLMPALAKTGLATGMKGKTDED